MRYAVIDQNGNVVNTVEWDGQTPYALPQCTLVQNDMAGIGWTYAGGTFTPPPPPAVTTTV